MMVAGNRERSIDENTKISTNRLPLIGVKVLDLTTFLSGPFCTAILADLGADVIKLESPHGDPSRHMPPYFVGADSAYYVSHNRNKRSIAVDLKSRDGQGIARQMVAESDIVVENFRPGVSDRLGLDVTKLRQEHPDLIWVSITGFGQEGAQSSHPAYDIIVQALSGVMSLNGMPDSPTVRLGIPAGDLVAGMYAAIAALAALHDRSQTGEGRWADISMLDGQLSMLSYQAVYSGVGNMTPKPQGSRHDSIPTYRTFVSRDNREVAVAANTQRMWVGLCQALGVVELLGDPRFASAAGRLEHERELEILLETAFRTATADHLVKVLQDHSVPVALIKTVPEAMNDARASHRGMIVTVESDDGERVDTIDTPVRFIPEPHRTQSFPPRLGAHTRTVLEDLGYSEEEVAALLESGVVAQG